MSAQIAEKVVFDPYCVPCKVTAMFPLETRSEAEMWAAKHDAEHHPEPELEDA